VINIRPTQVVKNVTEDVITYVERIKNNEDDDDNKNNNNLSSLMLAYIADDCRP